MTQQYVSCLSEDAGRKRTVPMAVAAKAGQETGLAADRALPAFQGKDSTTGLPVSKRIGAVQSGVLPAYCPSALPR